MLECLRSKSDGDEVLCWAVSEIERLRAENEWLESENKRFREVLESALAIAERMGERMKRMAEIIG